jgi:hypothetical protein
MWPPARRILMARFACPQIGIETLLLSRSYTARVRDPRQDEGMPVSIKDKHDQPS